MCPSFLLVSVGEATLEYVEMNHLNKISPSLEFMMN